MRYIKYILITFCMFVLNVYADTCSYQEQSILNNDFSNVKITYEIINDNQINLLIYNITENIYFTYFNYDNASEENIYSIDTTKGKYIIERTTLELEEYNFQIKSNLPNCYGNILTTKKIIKPKYNEFHKLEICQNEKLKNHSYCQKFITQNIEKNEKEVIKTLEEFLSVKVEGIPTTKVVQEKNNMKEIITYSVVGLIAIIIIVILLLIKKKRGEL